MISKLDKSILIKNLIINFLIMVLSSVLFCISAFGLRVYDSNAWSILLGIFFVFLSTMILNKLKYCDTKEFVFSLIIFWIISAIVLFAAILILEETEYGFFIAILCAHMHRVYEAISLALLYDNILFKIIMSLVISAVFQYLIFVSTKIKFRSHATD